ncbi:MAG: GTP-binding protein [Candidatus Lokiarchaeia archaeon]|nr:GTP-binding protein [Candidatus Lokiarchaeia archaeon]
MGEEYLDDLFKIIVLGASGVGKTTIMEQYGEKVFEEHRTQKMGVNFFTKELKVNGDNYKLQLWDFISDKQFETFHQLYASGASAILFVFDLTRPETFDYHKICLKNIWWQINLNRAPLLLIGNKLDIVESQDKIERKKYRDFVIKEGIYGYIETSSDDISQLEEKIPSLVKQIVYLKSFYGKNRPRNTRAKVFKEIKQEAIPSHIEGKFLKKIDQDVLEEREREKFHRMEELEKVKEALKKTQQVKFLVDEKELDFIKKYAQFSHQTQSEFIRTAIWEKIKSIDDSSNIDNSNEEKEDKLRLDELVKIRELLGRLKK